MSVTMFLMCVLVTSIGLLLSFGLVISQEGIDILSWAEQGTHCYHKVIHKIVDKTSKLIF